MLKQKQTCYNQDCNDKCKRSIVKKPAKRLLYGLPKPGK